MRKIKKALVVKNNRFELGTTESDSLIQKLIGNFKAGLDYAVVIKGKKPTLLVPGADKLTFRFNLMAEFSKDTDTIEIFKDTKNLAAIKCVLIDRFTDRKVGEGRGAAVLGEGGNCKDINSTIKMAEIRAKRDAVLNTFPLRDRFTQDLEAQVNVPAKVSVNEDGELVV